MLRIGWWKGAVTELADSDLEFKGGAFRSYQEFCPDMAAVSYLLQHLSFSWGREDSSTQMQNCWQNLAFS